MGVRQPKKADCEPGFLDVSFLTYGHGNPPPEDADSASSRTTHPRQITWMQPGRICDTPRPYRGATPEDQFEKYKRNGFFRVKKKASHVVWQIPVCGCTIEPGNDSSRLTTGARSPAALNWPLHRWQVCAMAKLWCNERSELYFVRFK
jgi:hypothetical protein